MGCRKLSYDQEEGTKESSPLKICKGIEKNPASLKKCKDYYPFGLTFGSYQRASEKENKFLYNGKELQKDFDLNWSDYGARMYMPYIGRWGVVDPLAYLMPSWSTYTFSFNNPINFIDLDGRLPWRVQIRSFISASKVAGGYFRGDGRGPSIQNYPQAWSRARSSFTIDPAKGTVSNFTVGSDPTIFYGGPGPGGIMPPIVRTPKPKASINNIAKSENSLSLDFKHSAKDPITPGLITPDLDVQASINITENLEEGFINITGTFTGDAFPSTEAFITDQSGETKLFLGAHKEQGSIGKMFGENKIPTFSVNMQVNIDSKGNFTGVTQGDKTYTVSEWNKHVQSNFNK